MNVFVTDFFDDRASITVESLRYDPLIATDALKNALVTDGFKVISERVAREKIELSNKGQVTDSTFNQDISMGRTKYLNSVFSFSQSSFEGKCTIDVMNAFAKKLKEQSKNKKL